MCGTFGGCGFGKVLCPGGPVDEPIGFAPGFGFQASNAGLNNSHILFGSWESDDVHGGMPGPGQLSDSGTIKQLHFNGTHFEARGNWIVSALREPAPTSTNQTVVLCPGTPLNNSTMVTISGECNSHQIDFAATNGVKATYQGTVTCTDAHQVLTVNSVDLSGNPLPGVYTVIRSTDAAGLSLNPSPGVYTVIRPFVPGGTILKTGFTPFTFIGNTSTSYEVSVANYDGKAFKHWEDGGTSHTRTIGLGTTATTIVASYKTGHSLRGFTSLTYNGTNGTPDLTVEAKILDDGSNKTLHMWTLISPQTTGSTVGTATYRVYATNGYQNLVFDHWGDSGSTDRIRDITISKDTTITAYYRMG
jgi:hypothetical protein